MSAVGNYSPGKGVIHEKSNIGTRSSFGFGEHARDGANEHGRCHWQCNLAKRYDPRHHDGLIHGNDNRQRHERRSWQRRCRAEQRAEPIRQHFDQPVAERFDDRTVGNRRLRRGTLTTAIN